MTSTRTTTTRCGIALVAIFTLICATPYHTLATVTVEPVRFELVLSPGERATDVIKVANTGISPADVTAIIQDWDINEENEILLFAEGQRPDSLAPLVKLNPRRFHLEPGEVQYVRFTLTGPSENAEVLEYRGIVFFEELIPYETELITATVRAQVGTTIYLASSLAHIALRLSRVQVVENADGGLVATMRLQNEGTAHSRSELTLRIVDSSGRLVTSIGPVSSILLPGRSTDPRIELPTDLTAGDYTLQAELRLTGTERAVVELAAFTVEEQ